MALTFSQLAHLPAIEVHHYQPSRVVGGASLSLFPGQITLYGYGVVKKCIQVHTIIKRKTKFKLILALASFRLYHNL